MTHNTILLTSPASAAFAAGCEHQAVSSQAPRTSEDYVQEAEIVGETPGQPPPFNRNLDRLVEAIGYIS